MRQHLALPALLAEIAEVAGVEAALALARERGGRRAHFIRNPKPGHWLSLLIGHDAAKAVGGHLCGSNASIELTVPMGPCRRDVARWVVIAQMIADNCSNAEIARKTGCHYKTVQCLRNGKRKTVAGAIAAKAAQGKLF